MPYDTEPLPYRARPADPAAAAREVFDRMASRRTVRDFSDRAVPEEAIRHAVATAGRAPSGANQQPWHFVAIRDRAVKARIRAAAEAEERAFYDGAAGDDWLQALAPIGTDADKPHLEQASWLIVVFAQRFGVNADGERIKHYYVPESVGIACGFLIATLHMAGLDCLTHTPAPMGFLREICGRPAHEKPVMILAVGYAEEGAAVPKAPGRKKAMDEILSVV
ncbi:nitroreductase family protein [Palleronia abyssalis]|uniref:Nitroreductase NfnB n=1 Tax=Palleronia abyssalis TaxID=1501240 RepID=A0A2R8BQJ6_9RHOB|nr:nitroreductase family protein [Palleronia abyssalis]SPJ22411.1 Nitroreductase NfnB [Palleronia abyssalis]